MLVLTRQAGERIFVGDGITITVVATGSKRVRIGIEAPPGVTIDREEIRCRRQREERLAYGDASRHHAVIPR